jgi:hypothetical protein
MDFFFHATTGGEQNRQFRDKALDFRDTPVSVDDRGF